jgi:hypothetical protein
VEKCLTRKQIEYLISQRTAFSEEHIHRILDELFYTMHVTFAQGKGIKMSGLGTFKRKVCNIGAIAYISFTRSKARSCSLRKRADEQAKKAPVEA